MQRTEGSEGLLEFRFLEHDVLTSLFVVLHQFELARRRSLVLGRGVKHARTSRALQLNFLSL